MQHRVVKMTSLEFIDDRANAVARAELRFKNSDGTLSGSGLSLEFKLSKRLRNRIRFEIENEIAQAMGDGVEPSIDPPSADI